MPSRVGYDGQSDIVRTSQSHLLGSRYFRIETGYLATAGAWVINHQNPFLNSSILALSWSVRLSSAPKTPPREMSRTFLTGCFPVPHKATWRLVEQRYRVQGTGRRERGAGNRVQVARIQDAFQARHEAHQSVSPFWAPTESA
jgi:hypothetical protein